GNRHEGLLHQEEAEGEGVRPRRESGRDRPGGAEPRPDARRIHCPRHRGTARGRCRDRAVDVSLRRLVSGACILLAVASGGPAKTTHLGSTTSSIPSLTPSPIPQGLVECQAYARAGLLVLHDTTSVVLGEVSSAQYDRESGPELRAAKYAC